MQVYHPHPFHHIPPLTHLSLYPTLQVSTELCPTTTHIITPPHLSPQLSITLIPNTSERSTRQLFISTVTGTGWDCGGRKEAELSPVSLMRKSSHLLHNTIISECDQAARQAGGEAGWSGLSTALKGVFCKSVRLIFHQRGSQSAACLHGRGCCFSNVPQCTLPSSALRCITNGPFMVMRA